MNKKSICWITPDCFVDVDVYIIKVLSSIFNIHWTLIESSGCSLDNEKYIDEILGSDKKRINVNIVKQPYRFRDPRNIWMIYSILIGCKKTNPDVYYISAQCQPYGVFIYKCMLPTAKVVFACHNVTTPTGATNENFAKKYTHIWLSFAKNINVFSKGQREALRLSYNNKNILYAPLAIKDYGVPTLAIERYNTPIIRFLNFGNIVDYKRVDLLIEAGNILYERNIKNFSIRIAGNCKQWNKYKSLIRHQKVFDLRIKRIPNEDIPNLFADCHYFVMPYQDIAQSGAITVAFRYNLPTIVSDIKPFEEFVENDKTGITFKAGDAVDLANKMQYAIQNFAKIHKTLCKNQEVFVEKELSLASIAKRYIDFFEKI